ncbi:MAG: gephyrin-like molybdotransferase Glp [Alphaproteobacteria bacterium]
MITYDKALYYVLSQSLLLSAEKVSLENAVNRNAAQDVFCDFPIPHFNNSAMDGYAIRSVDTKSAADTVPVIFSVFGHLQAGGVEQFYGAHSSIKIMTGACVPDGYDAVIPVELVNTLSQGKISISQAMQSGQNIRYQGEDFSKGNSVIEKGMKILPQHIMALAACGLNKISVFRKIIVGIITTGKELKNSSSKLDGNTIYNSNGPYLNAKLKNLGCEVIDFGIVPDDVDYFKSILQEKHKVDCFISTGAVSMGDHDFIPTAIESVGGEILFHKVAIRPGKPILFARLGKIPFFGLPGNPISTAVGFSFFVEPFLNAVTQQNRDVLVKAELDSIYKKKHELCQFLKAFCYVDNSSGCLKVKILNDQESFKIRSFSQSNCWAILNEGKKDYVVGDKVCVKYIEN